MTRSTVSNCRISCTDDGGIVIQRANSEGHLWVENNYFDSVRVESVTGGIIIYSDPEKEGPGLIAEWDVAEWEVGE